MFRRLGTLVRGFVARLLGAAERSNPEALLALEKENLREQVAKANQGLAAQAAHLETLVARAEEQEREMVAMRERVTSHLRAGNRGLAAQHALRLQTLAGELAGTRSELVAAEATYRDTTRARDEAVAAARRKLDSLRRDLDDVQVRRAEAEMDALAAGTPGESDDALASLRRLEALVGEERDLAAGRARLAREASGDPASEPELDAAQQQALADQALAAFAAAEGLVLDAPAPAAESPNPASSERRMGPLTETE